MADHTTNYNLELPAGNEFYTVDVANSNFDIIDDELTDLQSEINEKKSYIDTKTDEAIADVIGGASSDIDSIAEILDYADRGFSDFESRIPDYLSTSEFETMRGLINSYNSSLTSRLSEDNDNNKTAQDDYYNLYKKIINSSPDSDKNNVTYIVTKISNGCFENNQNIRSVTIQAGITSIGNNAFNNCINLVNISIPNSVTSIGSAAFQNCSSLTNIIIPEGVTRIEANTFNGCTSLINVTIPSTVTYIDETAFLGCASLNDINGGIHLSRDNQSYKIENGVLYNIDETSLIKTLDPRYHSIDLPETLTSLGSFAGCSFTSITIPEGVIRINALTFKDCNNLTTINIPSTVTHIDESAFAGCYSLTEINVDSDNSTYISNDGIVFTKSTGILVRYPTNKTGAHYSIPNTVLIINNYAFEGCRKLQSIDIPSSVKTIGENAFLGSSINELVIDANNTEYTFENSMLFNIDKSTLLKLFNMNYTGIVVPNTVTTIGGYAFSDCDSLESIIMSNAITSINRYAFKGCTNLHDISLPDSIIDPSNISDTAFLGCDVVILCSENSAAETFAKNHFIKYGRNLNNVITPSGHNFSYTLISVNPNEYEASYTGNALALIVSYRDISISNESHPLTYYVNKLNSKIGNPSLINHYLTWKNDLTGLMSTLDILDSSVYDAMMSVSNKTPFISSEIDRYINDDNIYHSTVSKNVVMIDLDQPKSFSFNSNYSTVDIDLYEISVSMQKYTDDHDSERCYLQITENLPFLLVNCIVDNQLTYDSDVAYNDALIGNTAYSYLIIQDINLPETSKYALNVVKTLPVDANYVVICKLKIIDGPNQEGYYRIDINLDDIPTYYNTDFLLKDIESIIKNEYISVFNIKNDILTDKNIESGIDGLHYDSSSDKYTYIANDLYSRTKDLDTQTNAHVCLQHALIQSYVDNDINIIHTLNNAYLTLTIAQLREYLIACQYDYNIYEERILINKTDNSTTISDDVPHDGKDGILETRIYTSKSNPNITKYDTVNIAYTYYQQNAVYRCRALFDISTQTFNFIETDNIIWTRIL